jgi:hypothetical protein
MTDSDSEVTVTVTSSQAGINDSEPGLRLDAGDELGPATPVIIMIMMIIRVSQADHHCHGA